MDTVPNNQNLSMEEQVKMRAAQMKERQKEIDPKANAAAAKMSMEEKINSIPVEQIMECLFRGRLGDAEIYNYLHKGLVVFVEDWERFLIWKGHHWIEDKQRGANQLIENVCAVYERLVTYQKDKAKEAKEAGDRDGEKYATNIAENVRSKILSLRDVNGRKNLLEMSRQIKPPLSILPDVLDQQHFKKACPNGVIDLKTGQLLEGKAEDYLLNALETEYDPSLLELDDPCPETNAFLLSSMNGNEEVVSFIWRLLGYGLITKRLDQVFIIFWGEHGRNGKDTLIKLVTHVLGKKLSCDINVEMFLQSNQNKNSSAPAPDVMALRGCCIAWINEAEENQRFAHNKYKKMSGGNMITARSLQDKEMTTWQQTHLPIMTTNEIPRAKADDSAFWTRTIVVKWPLSFVENPTQPYERKADKYLDEKLQAEAKGVLARMVRGAMDYLKDGLQIPKVILEWTKDQRASCDDVGQFFDEWCEREPHQDDPSAYQWRTINKDLFDAFTIWFKLNRDSRDKYGVSAKKFGELLNKKEIPLKMSNGRWRLGIRLNNLGQEALDEARGKLSSY